MTHPVAGTFTIVGKDGTQEIEYLRKFTKNLHGFGVQYPVEFALHVHPVDKRTLVISEMRTGHDTQMRVLHPKTRQPLNIYSLPKFTTGQLRRLAQSAIHTGLAKIGHENFLAAMVSAGVKLDLGLAIPPVQTPAQVEAANADS